MKQTTDDYILNLSHITKTFPGVTALNDISLKVKRGEVLGLVGENGAGKSTLMKVLAGVISKDSGTIEIDQKEVRISSPLEAQKLGLSIIFQEFNLVNSLSIAENIFVGRLQKKGIRGIDWKKIYEEAGILLKKVGLSIDPREKVENLSVAGKQMTEIAKALSFQSKIIIMDEPSATLTSKELENLFGIIDQLKASGITVIYISHRLDEIFRLCDRVTIMRDGAVIDTKPIENLTKEAIISKMVGRNMDQEYPPREGTFQSEVVLEAAGLTRDKAFHNISFQLHKGERLGIAGLVGSGRTEIVRCIFGADKLTSGTITLNGNKVQITSPRTAIEMGIAFVTEDRKNQGLILEESLSVNTSLAALHKVTSMGFVDKSQEKQAALSYIEKLHTKTSGTETTALSLSGGNQQKVVLAKWLFTDAQIIILDEPTRGIDVGAKYELYQLINQLADEGRSIIIISSELPEIINMSDRLLVIHEGELKGELCGTDKTPENIMKTAILKEEK
ncbi:sugar ABC transporter ATP-binding protein [uncultured Robinsoniella sp.]|uniref:sugar ABC transporter ATP-binding protein n=1 Tax=uncultured Robinsoniella sp. TaxID=904190 RepID=UPI00374F68A9